MVRDENKPWNNMVNHVLRIEHRPWNSMVDYVVDYFNFTFLF